MALLRGLARLVAFALLVVIALLGAGVAVLAVTKGSVAPAFGLPAVRDSVAAFLGDAERGAFVAVAGGLGGMVVGVLLLAGLLTPARERLVIAERGEAGRLAARRRALVKVAEAVAGRARGVSAAKVKLKPRRRRAGGRLVVSAAHPRTARANEVKASVEAAIAELGEDFRLRTRVRAHGGEGSERVR